MNGRNPLRSAELDVLPRDSPEYDRSALELPERLLLLGGVNGRLPLEALRLPELSRFVETPALGRSFEPPRDAVSVPERPPAGTAPT